MDVIEVYKTKLNQRNDKIEENKKIQESLENQNKELIFLERCKEVIFMLRKELIESMSSKFQDIQTNALKDIVQDRDYEFILEIVSKRNYPNAEILIRKVINDRIKYHKLENSGDGIKSILRIASIISTLIFSSNRRIIFLDEESTGISKTGEINYYYETMYWLKKACEKFNIQLIFITHEPTTEEFADKIFHIEKGMLINETNIQVCDRK